MRLPRKLKKKVKKQQHAIKTAQATAQLVMTAFATLAQAIAVYKAIRTSFPVGGTIHKGEEVIIKKPQYEMIK